MPSNSSADSCYMFCRAALSKFGTSAFCRIATARRWFSTAGHCSRRPPHRQTLWNPTNLSVRSAGSATFEWSNGSPHLNRSQALCPTAQHQPWTPRKPMVELIQHLREPGLQLRKHRRGVSFYLLGTPNKPISGPPFTAPPLARDTFAARHSLKYHLNPQKASCTSKTNPHRLLQAA